MTIIIKPYYSQAETPTVRPPLLYSQEDPGAQAIQGVGRGVTALSDKLIQRLEQKKKEEEERRKAGWTCKAAESQAEFYKGELSKSGSQAKGAHQRGVDFHVGLMKEVQDSELAEPVKEGVLEHLGSSGRRILKNLARHEAVQHQDVKAEALQDRVKTWQTLAEAIGRDAEGAESILQDVDTYFEANRAWLNPELKAKIKGEVLPKLAETVGATGNLVEMHDFINRHRDQLDPKGHEAVLNIFNQTLINSSRLKPPRERIDMIESFYNDVADDLDASTRKRKVFSLLMEDFGRYSNDPVGFLTPDIDTELKRRVREGLTAESDRSNAFHVVAMEMQKKIGGPMKILSKKQASGIHDHISGRSPKDKIKDLRILETNYGRNVNRVLDEIEIPRITGHRLAAEILLSGDDDKLPTTLMAAADRDDADFKVDSRMKKNARDALRDSLGKTDYGRARLEAAKILSSHCRNREDLIGLETLVFKRALSYMEKGVAPEASLFSAAKEIGDCFHVISDPELGHVVFDKKYRVDIVDTGLRAIRSRLGEALEDKDQAFYLQKEGRWVNVGQFFVLTVPSSLKLTDKAIATVPEAVETYGRLAMRSTR